MNGNPLFDVSPGGVDDEHDRRIARDGLILLGMVGSTAYGLHLPGSDDRDQMGVCIEPPEYVVGLRGWQHTTPLGRSLRDHAEGFASRAEEQWQRGGER